MADPTRSYEIDPTRVKEGAQVAAGFTALTKMCGSVLDAILASVDAIPLHLRLLLFGVRRAAAARFPDAQLSAVGGILFLRFITPALVAPQSCGVWDHALPTLAQRGLLLCSKVLQALANNAQFTGVKESYMQTMNGEARSTAI